MVNSIRKRGKMENDQDDKNRFLWAIVKQVNTAEIDWERVAREVPDKASNGNAALTLCLRSLAELELAAPSNSVKATRNNQVGGVKVERRGGSRPGAGRPRKKVKGMVRAFDGDSGFHR